MLTLIEGLPDGVVGVEAHDKVTAEDYERVLVPAVEAARAAGDGKVRILYVLGHDFPDYTAGAAWEDTKLGLGHLRAWERIAVVSDAEWLRRAIHGLGWLMPGEVRIFELSELDAAREWVASPLPEGEQLY
jgi:SpoIIAA-like